MKMMKRIFFLKTLTILFLLIAGAGNVLGQTTVFSDDFSTDQSATWTTSGQIGSSAISVSRSGVDWGARRNTSPAQLELTNDASGTSNVAGWVFAYASTANFSTPYNTTLSSNTGLVTWYFNMRQSRTDPAGYGAGSYGAAYILATTSTSANNTGTGYAIVYGQSGSTDPIRLAKFSGGLSTGLTNIITSNTSGLTDFGTDYISCKVTYDPSNDQWELFLRNDGSTAFTDPTTGTLTKQGTATDDTYTSTSLAYMGGYWQGSTAGSQTAFFDNMTVQVIEDSPTPLITVNPSTLTGFTYVQGSGPSAEQNFSVSGSNLTTNISITPSTNYEISTGTGGSFTPTTPIILEQSGGSVNATTIYVRLKADLSTGNYNSELITATSSGAVDKTVTCNGSVSAPPDPEPSNHVTNFDATTNSHSQITVNWTDAAAGDQAPAAYLVKASTGTPSEPIDGTAEADGALVKNVSHGSGGEAIFTGLDPETTYNFSIWPYTNSGANIDYKTDVTVPTANATTDEAPEMPSLIISEVTDPVNFDGRFVELYNAGETVIDFSTTTIYFDRQANGGNHSSIQLTGSIGAKETYVIGNATNINSVYGINADLNFGSVTGNGDDGYFLFFDGDQTTGTLMDAYGVIDVQATASDDWYYADARAVRNSNITSPNATWTASEWTITAADVADCTPGEHNGNVSWKGGTGNWNSAANWSNGTVPSASDNIIIPDGASLSVDVAATVNNINVQNGGELTINASQSLSVSGTITIESGGSFINQGTLDDGLAKGDADAVVQRSINAYTAAANGWHLLSSPVATFNINDNAGIDPGAEDDFYGFNEVTYTWMNHKQGDPSQMVPGTGYLVAYETTATKEFTGTLNNAAVPFPNLSKTAGQGEGWHLVGNPFQSAIKWNDPVGDWNLSNINGTAKLMTNVGGFDDLVAGNPIPAMQGFWIQAESSISANNSFTIPLTAREHNAMNWVKKSNNDVVILAAHDLETGMLQKSWIRFNTEATAAFDSKFDSRFMAWQAPQLYSIIENEKLSTNTYPSLDEEMVIPFGFEKNEASNFAIELLEGPEGKIIYLTDNQTGFQHNLSENPVYSFTSNEGDNPNRFLIHFGALSLDESSLTTAASAYVHNSSLYVLNASGQTQVDIIDLQGRTLQSSSFRAEGLYSQPISLPKGVYVVRVMDEKGVRTAKVVVE